jgi:hypothetical protein
MCCMNREGVKKKSNAPLTQSKEDRNGGGHARRDAGFSLSGLELSGGIGGVSGDPGQNREKNRHASLPLRERPGGGISHVKELGVFFTRLRDMQRFFTFEQPLTSTS